MKIPAGKIVVLVVMAFIYGTGMIALNMRDTLRTTRVELTRFYEAKMDKCVIERIDTLKYPSRGTYQIFYTDCTTNFYPIFITKGSPEEFKIGSSISKESNSVDIELSDGGKISKLKIRHPDTEDDRGFGTKMFLVFIAIVTVLILLTPNSKFKLGES